MDLLLYETSLVHKLLEFDLQTKKCIHNKKDFKKVLTISIRKNHEQINPIAIYDRNINNITKITENGGKKSSEELIENGLSNDNNINKNVNKNKNQDNNIEQKKNTNNIKLIKHNKFCLFFCGMCYSFRNTNENILLEKGMKLIKKNLDIITIFKKLYHDEKRDNEELNKIKMTIWHNK